MILKQHLSGDYIVYEPLGGNHKEKLPTASRPQGSLVNQQKRAIADACEFLRIDTKKKPDRCALIFTLTSPGYFRDADLPRFVSSWFDAMRKNHGLGEYVWVREYTKKGYPHFHCIADWWEENWFFTEQKGVGKIYSISKLWSSYFNSTANNSVWLGGYWYGKRIYHLRSQTQARYLCKYLGKQFNQTVSPAPTAGIVPQPVIRKQNLFVGSL